MRSPSIPDLHRRSGRIPALPYPPSKQIDCTAGAVSSKAKSIHCQGKVEMSYSQQSRNVLFCRGVCRRRVRLNAIPREVALPGKIQSRGDGAGSEADGTKPPVKPGPMLPVLGVLAFESICFGGASERRLWIDQARRCRAASARLPY